MWSKTATEEMLNITHHMEDGFEKGLVSGVVFVDLATEYDTVSHRILREKKLWIADETN